MVDFDAWLDKVDVEFQGLIGMSIHDVEDFPYYAMWEDGETAGDVALLIFSHLVGL